MSHPSQPARLAVFDLDGTLLDSLPDLAAASARLLRSYDLGTVPPEAVRSMVGDGAGVLVTRLLAYAGDAANGVDLAEATRRYIADYTPRSLEETRLFPGTEDALDALRGAGWKLAVCTNKPVAAARHILEGMGIAPLFVSIVGGDSYPTRKPDAGPLLGAIEQAQTTPARTVMVGDHHNDVLCASGCDALSIFARWGYGRPEMEAGSSAACASITDVPDLANTLIAA